MDEQDFWGEKKKKWKIVARIFCFHGKFYTGVFVYFSLGPGGCIYTCVLP